uniref:Phosphoribosyl-ATP diphosphatase n=1 Tax=viral metagenome TaxID=1070528 RepID=A0A6C0JYG0_9ZZZZ
MNVFEDQAKFMLAVDNTVGEFNPKQFKLYLKLIVEEFIELLDDSESGNRIDQLDDLIDLLVVTIGTIHSLGVNPEDAWKEVIRSNMSKVDPITGKVLKREDGKVIKPEAYSSPFLNNCVIGDELNQFDYSDVIAELKTKLGV